MESKHNAVAGIAEPESAEEMRARLAAIVELSDDAIISKNLDGIITSWNPAAERIFGYTAAEAIGQPLLMLFPSDRLGEEPEILARLKRGERTKHFETVRIRKDGQQIDVSVTISPLRDSGGNIIGASKIARDITDRKCAEAGAAHLAAIVRTSDDAIIGQDLNNFITSWNRGAERLLGFSAGEVVGTSIMRLISPELQQQEKDILESVKHGQSLNQFETVNLTKDGRLLDVSVTASAIQDLTGKLIGVSRVARDISERKRAVAAMLQQEGLRALGQMASGIAHNINNAITPVVIYTETLLETEPNLRAETRGYLQIIRRSTLDVASTVRRLQAFHWQRETQLALAPVTLNHVVEHAVALTRARWSDEPQQRGVLIEIRTHLGPDLAAIMGVEGEIRDALTNLIFNAVDAMPGGGSLTLRTGPGKSSSCSASTPDAWHAYLEVVDTGAGMDEETRRHCLEPFFTTKGERGTGLGLAMVYGMVQRHRAEIEIESAPGKGTTVRVIFLVDSAGAVGTGQPPESASLPGSLRILVIDDDPMVIESVRDTLILDGHAVTTAPGGQAGIDAFRLAQASGEPFAVVITDLGMPYVDGRKVANSVKADSPTTPVILLTGWGQQILEDGGQPPNVNRLLSKPPKLLDLREALAHCCPPPKPSITLACLRPAHQSRGY